MALLALAQPTTLTILTHDSFNLDKNLLAQFERQSGIRLRFLKGGDAGEMLNKAILSKGAPIADVIYGFDNTLLSRALQADILQPYRSPELPALRPELLLDQTFRATPVDFGYVALNYDRDYFKDKPLPERFADLASPEFARLLVVQNPASSSPGLAFLLATVAAFGEDGYLGFWENLRKNGVRVVSGWSDAYYTHFTRAGGDRPLVVSYSTSPAAELYYSEAKPKPAEPPTANLFLPKSSFFQVEYVGILKGTRNLRAAQRFVDWLVSKPAQENIPTEMWVYPARREARLPEVFRFAEVPSEPARLSPQQITQNRERWIREWTQVVVQGQSADAVRARR
ncbi:thiamine ABC transporter substrate-binding protein [Meiothermus sp. CFH 77666]|uniref:thiamine ABC transporter substrate-binding protein n=1 Tax=Meiothermus sp. CFH 77666 TaxID=2817942 RepID=UPI001AA076B2|nr:thiamine ABC transporter substrate-binding protein [Meiothermus sp. CFH 77666]MBO1438528.1 thiamine ABC transporter substrate-binding protein [Meiothermus sp. CFH 77666]